MKKILFIILTLCMIDISAQAQMYYQHTNDLQSVITYESRRNNVNRFVLEALTRTLMNNKAELGGFYGMHLVVGENVSAESLVSSLARLMDLCATANLRAQQDAIANDKPYNAGTYDDIINELHPPYGSKSNNVGKTYYKNIYNQIIRREQNK